MKYSRTFLGVLLSCLMVLSLSPTAGAINLSGFEPGYIISNSIFTDKNSLSASQIQSFLNSKVPSCDTNGQQDSEYGGPDLNSDGRVQRWEWGQQNYNQSTFTCLRNYSEGGKSGAQIIYDAAQEFSISPKVLIVLLQKEQALITDTWPLSLQYRSATGYGCPDNAACNSDYYGFKNQVRWAARMFRAIMNDSPTWYTPYELGNNSIPWHPNTGSCGYSTVNILNSATQALYNYTPYRPNQAALDSGFGSGNSCSSYGNRNFYAYFTSWFGGTVEDFVPLDRPRWMQLSVNTYKTRVFDGTIIEPELLSGRQIYFPDKIKINDNWYLRTQYDNSRSNLDGIVLDDLEEIPVLDIADKWVSLMSPTNKIDPIVSITYENLPPMMATRVVDELEVNGVEYYRTEYESGRDRTRSIRKDETEDFRFYDFIKPRTLKTKESVDKINVLTGEVIETIPKASLLFFDKRITIDGVLYAQVRDDSSTDYAIAFSGLSEVNKISFVPLDNPRWMKLSTNIYKTDLLTGSLFGPELLADRQIYFPTKTYINGEWYLRTNYDTANKNGHGIRLDDLKEI